MPYAKIPQTQERIEVHLTLLELPLQTVLDVAGREKENSFSVKSSILIEPAGHKLRQHVRSDGAFCSGREIHN